MLKNLTQGSITKQLIAFTLPLILGNIFQLTYNAADSIIIGRFAGTDALAAVGTCNPIITMAILFINGLCMGASILIGNYFGADDIKKLKREISTTMIFGLFFSVVFSILCIIFAPLFFRLIQTPIDIIPESTLYLRIILSGFIFTFFYNFFACTLRALGDSKSPLYFLIISSVINICGDLFFVVCLKMDIAGCAISTILSEALSCILCLIYIKYKVPLLSLGRNWLICDKQLLKKTLHYGWSSALQQAIVPFGKIIVQSMINSLGTSVIAAMAAVNRIDDFAYTPMQNIGHATTAFMAQNEGAGDTSRMKTGTKKGLLIGVCYGIFVMTVCYLFARPIMFLFTKDELVISNGITYLHLISVMYLLPAITNGLQGYFRGIGRMKSTLFFTIINIGTRCLGAFIFINIFRIGISAAALANLIGWLFMLSFELPSMIKSYKRLGEN